ncbi:MAG: hypothetical protein JWR85_3837 [Marmoricola sp.]|nr:hypothetical protein [Marmoricola sp.]
MFIQINKESELVTEIEAQIYRYLDLCAMWEREPSILGFSQHLMESYR